MPYQSPLALGFLEPQALDLFKSPPAFFVALSLLLKLSLLFPQTLLNQVLKYFAILLINGFSIFRKWELIRIDS